VRHRIQIVVAFVLLSLAGGFSILAVSRIRETAQRTACSNNLRQIGIAVFNYQDVNGKLPPMADQGDGAPTGRGLPSVFAILIPYVEATPFRFQPDEPPGVYHAHSSIPFPYLNKDGSPGTTYGGVANQVFRVFIDPADRTADALRDIAQTLPDGMTGYYASGSYTVNGLLPWGKKQNGLHDSSILLAERPQICRTVSGDVVYNLWGLGFYSPHMPAFGTASPAGAYTPTDHIVPVTSRSTDGSVQIEFEGDQTRNVPSPIQIIPSGATCDPRIPGTTHRAGMPVLLSDGSIRFFAPDTDPFVFWSACLPDHRPVIVD
jgi:hypothetical protein